MSQVGRVFDCVYSPSTGRWVASVDIQNEWRVGQVVAVTPNIAPADRERAITGEPVAWFVNVNQNSKWTTKSNWCQVWPGDLLWSDKWARFPLCAAPNTGEISRDVVAEGESPAPVLSVRDTP